MNESHIRNVVEAALLAAGRPLQPAQLVELFDENARPQVLEIHAALEVLVAEYSARGIEIKETAAGFRIQVRRELANEISRLWPERPAKYSRALLETLALIAYRQPITRGEIEAVRGVAVNPNILKTVIERNWVRVVGHRDVPGRPELLGTTRDFLDYFGLKNLDELPPLAELKTLGDIKVQFDLPDPGPLGEPESPARPVAKEGTDGTAKDPGPNVVRDDAAGQSSDDAAPEDGPSDDAILSAGAGAKAVANVTSSGAKSTSDTALHDAEEFAAAVDAELASADDDGAEEDELSAAGPASGELVAGPRDLD
jgi:segregation and condensation protein B